MLRKRTRALPKQKVFIKVNHYIHCPQVRVLTDRGEMVGIMPTSEALSRAMEEEKDLVLVTEKSSPPIAKIIELSKYKYQLQQKEAEGRKKARTQDIKEMRFSPFIGDNDYESKARRVTEFLQKGHKVKLSLLFKGRQIAQKDLGFEIFKKLIAANQDWSEVEIEPKMIGMRLQAQLTPAKKSKQEETTTAAKTETVAATKTETTV